MALGLTDADLIGFWSEHLWKSHYYYYYLLLNVLFDHWQVVKLLGQPITSWWKNQIMATPKNIIVLRVSINGLTFYKPERLEEPKVSFIPIWFVTYHLDVTLK